MTFVKGFKHSEEWKQKMRERMLGNTRGFVKGKPSPRKGMKANSPIWNKAKKMPQTTGENNSRWKGGKSRDIHSLHNPKYRDWRIKIFTRDGFNCRTRDGNCTGEIQAHHIFRWAEYPELRYEKDNGITLCKFHHPRKRNEEIRLAQLFLSLINSDISHLIVKERSVELNVLV